MLVTQLMEGLGQRKLSKVTGGVIFPGYPSRRKNLSFVNAVSRLNWFPASSAPVQAASLESCNHTSSFASVPSSGNAV